MAQEVPFKVSVDTGTADKTIGELRQEFRDLNKVINETKAGTDEYNKAVVRLGAVKGTLQDVRQQMLALDPEKRLAAFSRVGSTIASGFSAATAAAALFGDKNEELGKTIVKVQAASALAQGLSGLGGLTKAIHVATLAMRAFALSNPFTAILAGVVALTVAVYGLVKAFDKTADQIEKLKRAAEDLDEFAKNTELFWSRQIKLLEAQGKSLEDIHARRKEMIREQLQDNSDAIKIQQALVAKGDEDAIKKLNELEEKRKDLLADREIEELKFASDKAKRDDEVTKKEAEELKKRNELSAKSAEEKKKHDEALWKEELKLLDDSIDDAIKLFDKEVAAEQKQFEDREQAARDFYANTNQLLLDNMAAQAELDQDPIAEENARYQQQLENFRIYRETHKVDSAAADEAERLAKLKHEKNLTDITKNGETQRRLLRLQLVSSGLDAVSQLVGAFAGKSEAAQKKAFQVQKALGIAQATVDTYVAAQGAYRSQMTPPTPDSPIRAAVAAGIAVIAGLARVAAIAKTEFNSSATSAPSGGGGDFGSVQSGGAEAPVIQPPQVTATQTQTNSDGDFTGFNRTPLRAYVVESEMTEKQKRVRGIESRSEF